ncbi:MAG: MarR family transcriptional regulator [Firmicutes bacterium]|nr:MarR family transcriptional regulator [Bacillota bacterium]
MQGGDLALKLLIVLSRSYKSVMAQVEKDIKGYGLAVMEFSVLELLYHKGTIPMQMIGDKVLMTSGNITYTVDKLEKKGLVRRVACPEDRRVTYAELTPEGQARFEDIFPQHQAAVQQITAGLSPVEQAKTIELLKKLGHAAKAN